MIVENFIFSNSLQICCMAEGANTFKTIDVQSTLVGVYVNVCYKFVLKEMMWNLLIEMNDYV